MSTAFERVTQAIKDLQQGKLVILSDHPDRENEGDLIAPAEIVNVEQMNFMIRHGGGIVCMPMTTQRLTQLQLPLMVPPQYNSSSYCTPFTVSIDAREGTSTGVSAEDRIRTVRVAVDPMSKAEDLAKPGHVFPLQAKAGGVLERQGHTEGATDLVTLAGFKPAAVISEVMNEDGSMATGEQLIAFAKQHKFTLLSIDDIIAYRKRYEDLIEAEVKTNIPLEHYGLFELSVFRERISGYEHILLSKQAVDTTQPTLVRIHSACTTGDLFSSNRCDCHKQLHYSLDAISKEGGMLIYLQQEGRGIGLFNKIKAYALQENGLDTVEANVQLGLPIDSRSYSIAANVLRNRGINSIRLMTNNPNKIADMHMYGIEQVERIIMPSFHNEHNKHYLQTKACKLNHVIQFEPRHELERKAK